MSDFAFKTAPLKHQAEIFAAKRDEDGFALFWEQGVGKSKPALDVAAHHWLSARCRGLIVVAPKGVDRNWISDELPLHMPVPYLVYLYRSSAGKTKRHEAAARALLAHEGLSVLVLSYEAFRTDAGKKLAKAMLTSRRCMMALDESQMIKNPSAKRTMTIVAAGKYAEVKWLLSGTPVTKRPLDVYSQMKFLDEDFWKKRGIGSFTAMRARFEITEPRGAPGRQFNVVLGYRDPEVIRDWIKPHSSRLLKTDCLDLPPKIYTKRYFEMTPKQDAAYVQLRTMFAAMIEDGSLATEVTALNPMVRLLRLQQITSGYLPDPEDAERYIEIDPAGGNARLRCLLDELEAIEENAPGAKVIIWYRFRRDGDVICQALGSRAVRYDGKVPDAERPKMIARFRDAAGAQYFCANPQTIGRGVTLNEAHDVVYYNNSFNLEHRLQSEDRCHRVGQTHPVRYVDMIAEDTVDNRIVEVLRGNKQIASVILGDDPRAWI